MHKEEKIIFWSEHARALQGTVGDKIEAIVQQKCIAYDHNAKIFYVKPIMQKNGKPYNSTTYEIGKHVDPEVKFSCNCQGFRMKEKKWMEGGARPSCSHIAALFECFARKMRFDGYDGYEYRQETLRATMEVE